ncbi:hypothetical protein BD324DRAFT_626929 [Kockovaella imperatae]|uniref:Uncharacterized protein n=1 Tax=Kockovaella imperatae TaxID=4999 RepID=A0A1Y1UFB5_9TREE|nr:hypothetical protein BD324DRAFT_626929 [Kockovaella imperatae]ORX36718.1 hypothetical protein BD324DRAFT_626929 [Kockovaella imperatae]
MLFMIYTWGRYPHTVLITMGYERIHRRTHPHTPLISLRSPHRYSCRRGNHPS